jgi:putative DNA primase/helicase
MPDDGMFAPLGAEDTAVGAESGVAATKPKPRPIIPVPADAPRCRWRHPKYGSPDAMWPYSDADGRLVGYAARFEYIEAGESRKDVLPLTFCEIDHAKRRAWRARSVPTPRPLYRLPELLAAPASPVIVTEGEKKADAISGLFPGHCGTTSMAGAHAAARSDWAPLVGRDVSIWPDHDEPGQRYAEDIGALATAAGAASVAIVDVPEDWPEGWDLADPLPEGVSTEMLSELLRLARPWTSALPESLTAGGGAPEPAYVSFGYYRMGAQRAAI